MNNRKDKKELFDILDEALDRVLKGEDINSVLAGYPQHADELEPLLRTAVDTRNAASIKPRPEFRQRAALEFQKAIQQMPVKAGPAAEKHPRGIFGWGAAWSAAFAVVLVVLLSGTGVVAAASQAMPDNPLYSVKLATESMQLVFTPSEEGKAELISKFNDRRVAEVVNMAEKGMATEISVLNARMTDNMNRMSGLTEGAVNTIMDEQDSMTMATFNAGNAESVEQNTALKAPVMTTAAAPEETYPPQTPVPAATRTPQATTTTSPASTQSPAPAGTQHVPVVTPTITVELPEPTTTTIIEPPPGASLDRNSQNMHDFKANGDDKWEKLKGHLSEKQIKNLRALLAAYQNASDEMKPSILQTIKIIVQGYGLSYSNSSDIFSLLEAYGIPLDQILN